MGKFETVRGNLYQKGSQKYKMGKRRSTKSKDVKYKIDGKEVHNSQEKCVTYRSINSSSVNSPRYNTRIVSSHIWILEFFLICVRMRQIVCLLNFIFRRGCIHGFYFLLLLLFLFLFLFLSNGSIILPFIKELIEKHKQIYIVRIATNYLLDFEMQRKTQNTNS